MGSAGCCNYYVPNHCLPVVAVNAFSCTPHAFSCFCIILVPDWAPEPVQMCRYCRDIPGRALKVGFGRVFVGKVDFLSKFKPPSVTYPFFEPLIHQYLFTNASTRFVMCFSFPTRSSNLFSVSQSLPNHEFFKNG